MIFNTISTTFFSPTLAAAINVHSLLFLIFGTFASVFAIAVVFSANVVRMAFFLVISLAATSGLFFLANADFVGAMQLMIYVGGTLVLLIFGVMLTSSGPMMSLKTRAGEWVLAAIVGGSLMAVLIPVAFSVEDWHGPSAEDQKVRLENEVVTSARLGSSLLGLRSDKAFQEEKEQQDPTLQQKSRGMSGYLLPFEIVSIHLLVVLIGAAYLARAKKKKKNQANQ